MSGIFKGDSIYKSGGGGGGGYKDGGELVDGDFIKVENNTISSYDNVSRDPVRFYFDLSNGEVISSIIEFETVVNSTILVYTIKNGLYYLLGNVGGNTVTAGEQYTINIVGDSYSIEQVSGGSSYPAAVEIAGQIYGLTKIGSLLWTTENLRYVPDDNYVLISDGTNNQTVNSAVSYTPKSITTRGNVYYRGTIFSEINALSDFRVPTNSDFQSIKYTDVSHLMLASAGGDNSTGFNGDFCGRCSAFGSGYPLSVNYNLKPYIWQPNRTWCFWLNNDRYGAISQTDPPTGTLGTNQWATANTNSDYLPIRLCKDA